MQTRISSRALVRVTLVVFGAAVIMAAAPTDTLGARIYPRSLTWERNERTILVESLATVPVTAQVLIEDGEGWDIDLSEPFELKPNEKREVQVTAAGPKDAAYVVLMSASGPTIGADKTALRLEGSLRHATPWDDLSGIAFAIGAVGALVAALAAFLFGIRWMRRHVRVSVR